MKVHAVVLDFKSALDNWRNDPSPENTRTVLFTGGVLSGRAITLEEQLLLELESRPKGLTP